MPKSKELKISAISYGTVIDHIPSASTFKVASILKVAEHEEIISIASNLPSKRLGRKGIIKVAGKILSKDEFDKVAIAAPLATVNIIKDYKVEKKVQVEVPSLLIDLIKCSNPKCVTNNEQTKTKFAVIKKNPLKVKCFYCERVMDNYEIELK